MEYPYRFEVGRPHDGGRIGESAYLAGRACEAVGDAAKAREMFGRSVEKSRPGTPLAYYQALAWRKLGDESKARELLKGLREAGEKLINRQVGVNFFEKFGGQEDDRRQRAEGHYLVALAELGGGGDGQANLAKAIELNPNHLMAKTLLATEMRI